MKDESRQPTVLVVDDDEATRLLMKQALSQLDVEVVEAENGERAIIQFERYRPDLTLLDVSMPGMDGFRCCELLRQLSQGYNVAIVIVTSLDQMQDIERAFQVGATDFMTKPLKWPLFVHRVKYILKAHRTMQELSLNQNKLAKAQSMAHLVYWEWDFQSKVVDCSPDMFEMFGLAKDVKPTIRFALKQVHPEDRERVVQAVRRAISDKKPYDIEYRIVRPDGELRFINERTDINKDYDNWRIVGTLHDITARKQYEQEITYYAYYDTLTDLPNRRLFIEKLDTTITNAMRDKSRFALMFLDLDHFKYINDAHGHHVGDELLCQVSERILDCVRQTSFLPTQMVERDQRVARLAGDEFTVLMEGITQNQQISLVAQKLVGLFSSPFVIDAHSHYISASIGITVYPDDGHNVQTLLQHADVAMYHAKQCGRNNYQFYSESMNDFLKQRHEMENDLRLALQQQQFELVYQPQYDVNTLEIRGFEALLRWRHPVKGVLSPDAFMDIAESTGMIVGIGSWVMQEACRQLYEWQQKSGCLYHVAVNLSALQFTQDYLPAQLREVLDSTGIPAETLELEITETAMLNDISETISLLFAIKKTGVKLAIDDFGTGYSSMTYLKNFPIDTLKIDRSFIQDIVFNRKDAAIAQTIVQLADNLEIETIAEGVETEAQLRMLKQMGCNQCQGFYLSQPVSATEIAHLIGII